MKEFIALLIVALVLIAAAVAGKQRSKKGKGSLGGKPTDPTKPSEE
ncbi:MAG: hypothetical protein RIS35_785 [Pseudomonadota bacterium]|jgi:hypothetical protein